MAKNWTFFLAAACMTLPVFAQQPPLIDRELLFADPEISGAQLSPDGAYIAFMKPWNKTRNVWVKKTNEPFSAAHLVTADTKRPIPGYFWSRGGHYILFTQDAGGDENYNVFAVDPAAKPAAGSDAPAARNLTDLKGVRAIIYGVPKSRPNFLFVGINDRDKAWHDLYEVNIVTGEKKLLRKNTDRVVAWIFDNADQLRLAMRSADNGDTEILRVDADGFRKIYSCSVFETCGPAGFQPDNRLAYFESNKGDGVNLLSLMLLDPATGSTTLVESDPLKRVDLGGAIQSDKTHELLATIYVDDKPRVYWRDRQWEADYNLLKKRFPGNEINFGSQTDDESLALVGVGADVEPGETWLFDRKTKKLTLQYKLREKIDRAALSPMEAVRYPSSDGMEISAYLTLPKGLPAKNLPTIIFPHGGPWGRDMWGYRGGVQMLANRGYAVLQPNFRASTGYGKKLLDAGNGQWGEKMQDDLTWGVKYLVARGIADPKRVGIMGGSYGGYATLAGVTFTPDLYAAAVAIVAPSNLITLLDSIPAYWEAGRKQMYGRMADPNTPEGKAKLLRQSPLHSAAKIKTPLMVVQGANDPRVNKREADQIVIALRDRGFPVEYLVAPDEGHGFARPVNNMAMYAAAEKFLAKYLGGRYQEDMTPEVATRLKEITVDPKTVVLKVLAKAGAVGFPAVGVQPSAAALNYLVKMQMGAQKIELKLKTEVKESPEGWTITDSTTTPMGEMKDVTVVEKGTLAFVKRDVQQGPVTVHYEAAGNQLKGAMKMGGKDTPIDVDAGGRLFAEGAGAQYWLGLLPLAAGYSTTFRNFDMQKMKPKLLEAKVETTEKVTVAAGTFDTFKVHVTSADGGSDDVTLWIDQASRKPVKMQSTLAQAGGASMIAELQ